MSVKMNKFLLLPVVFSFVALSFFLPVLSEKAEENFLGAIFGCAIGDAMGRPTEFKSLEQIFSSYSNGIRSFKDFHRSDFWLDKDGEQFAPYTDDTAMAKLVLEELMKTRLNDRDLNFSMDALAKSFVRDMNSSNGWAAVGRAPGNTCLAGTRELARRLKIGTEQWGDRWWDTSKKNGGGCGSVMRAFSFGLLFADDVEKAEAWAVAHSNLTHGAPLALAACAAMAVGTALTVRQVSPSIVVEKMVEAAGRYDVQTAAMIERAAQTAQKNRDALASRGGACVERVYDISKPVFEEFEGWAAHDAIAAATYIFVLVPDNIKMALYLGVHTPGDSDSIACMAGALVGARVGIKAFPQPWIDTVENSQELHALGKRAAKLVPAFPNKK